MHNNKLRFIRKNKKGFSLVELIIVIAIMVALIAVMAPSFVKYIAKSHDAVMTQAAEDVLAFTKTEFAAGNLNGKGGIKVSAQMRENGSKYITVEFIEDADGDNELTYTPNENTAGSAGDGNDIERFKSSCGVDETKTCKSDLVYYIYVDNVISAHPSLEVESTVEAGG